MDNLTHTLAGAALGMAGLKRKTGLGIATLMIAANLPDIDALGLLVGENLAWRRGWSHGPIALVILPLLLAWAMLAFDRWQTQRGTRPVNRLPVRLGWVIALAYIGTLSHPLLDFLNTYGIRCLMPFSEQWFYGDTLFIIDVWVWAVLGLSVWLSRRREKRGTRHIATPAIIGLLLVSSYTIAMGFAGRAAERFVAQDIEAKGIGRPERVLASPVPINPFARRVVYDMGDAYGFGDFKWTPSPVFTPEPGLIPTNIHNPAIAEAAAQNKEVADFLYWSRYPFAIVRTGKDGQEVIIGDARYNTRPDDGRFNVSAWVPESSAAPAP